METSSLTFAEPAWFFALAIVPVVAGLYFWSQHQSDALITKVVAPRLRSQLAGAVSLGTRVFKAILILAAFMLIVVALARPQKGYISREVTQRGRDIIIAVDTSKSMLATDVTPTRLARAKLVAQDFLNLVEGDRVGLIAFAGSAFLQAPLTLDFGAVLNSLDELDTDIIPKGGTNIGAAIRMAEDAFGKGEGATKVMIILTDGEELDADGIAAARHAKERGMHIFTLGIGSGEGSLIPIKTDDGTSDFVRDQSGKPVQSRLDENRLREIAEAGGGFYEPMSAESARIIFEKGILPLEATERDVASSRQPLERYQWPLGGAIVLLVLWSVLGERRRMARTVAAAAALLIFSPQVWAQTGLEEYQAGKYDKALADFEKRLQAKPDSDKLQFNAGAASYKSGDFAKAVDHFTKALLTEDDKFREQASYNLGNALVRRGEGAKGNEEKKADWKNAIQHYEEALKIDPANKKAEENRDIVKKMLEDLEKEEQQQQDQKDQQDKQDQKQDQKDQDKQDQKDQNQQGQSGQNQDQKDQQDKNQDQDKNDEGQSGDQKDEKNQDQKDQQKSEGKDQEKKEQNNQQQKDGQKGDQEKEDQKNDQGGDQQQNENQQEMAQNGQPQGDSQQNEQGNQPQAAPEPTPGDKKEGDLKTAGGNQQPQGDQQGQAIAEAEEEAKDGEMSASQARGLLNSVRSEEQRVRLMQPPQNEETLKDW